MSSPLATIAFVPREVFSTTKRSLERLLAATSGPYELVVVDGGSPPDVEGYLSRRAEQCGFTLLRSEHILSPNQARNFALDHVHTKYVVFMDNDVLPAENWLQPLVECAEETGAWVVGPKYFEHEPECARLHMYGGECGIQLDDLGRRTYVERHHLAHRVESSIDEILDRRATELVEFHTILVKMEAFEVLGKLDEGFLSVAEHGDLCLSVRAAGHTIYLEPNSHVTYVPPRSLTSADRVFFAQRWSETWLRLTLDRMNSKYQLHPAAEHGRESSRFVSDHRRYALGWMWKLRKRIGVKATKRLEKWIVGPVENWLNRLRFPAVANHNLSSPHIRIVHTGAPAGV